MLVFFVYFNLLLMEHGAITNFLKIFNFISTEMTQKVLIKVSRDSTFTTLPFNFMI